MDKKRETIAAMFDEIAFKYDFLNHFLTLGIDKTWRTKVVKMVKKTGANKILDIAAGTGDLSIEMARKIDNCAITGIDISEGMLKIARQKSEKCELSSKIEFTTGDALALEYKDNDFDALTVAFGVRNFENLEKGMCEMLRVVKNSGLVVILELSMPQNSIVKWGYNLYFQKILPIIGRLTSKSDFAYTYLPLSVENFIAGDKFLELMSKSGYKNVKKHTLFFGVATIYSGQKPEAV